MKQLVVHANVEEVKDMIMTEYPRSSIQGNLATVRSSGSFGNWSSRVILEPMWESTALKYCEKLEGWLWLILRVGVPGILLISVIYSLSFIMLLFLLIGAIVWIYVEDKGLWKSISKSMERRTRDLRSRDEKVETKPASRIEEDEDEDEETPSTPLKKEVVLPPEELERKREIARKHLPKSIKVFVPGHIDADSVAELLVKLENETSEELEDVSLDLSDVEEYFTVVGDIYIKSLRPGMVLEQSISLKPKYQKGSFPVSIRIRSFDISFKKEYMIKVGGTEVY